jgi:16S rRNA (cytosine967-C5)-methyltransferase
MSEVSARQIALTALQRWRTKKQNADAIISGLFAETPLSPPDRAFALELFYGVLRSLTLLDFWIHCLRRSHLDLDLRDILRLGLYQLFVLKTPEHAAVNETVKPAAKNKRPAVNAILRTAARNRQDLDERANQQPPHVRWSHPEFLLARWRRTFGERAVVDLCSWNNRPAPLYARINRLKISPTDFVRAYSALLLPDRDNFAAIAAPIAEATAAGHCYIQDPSTAIACELLQPKPGEKVLDACAAPGGKTGYLAEMMGNDGVIVACDRAPERLALLKQNIARLAVSIVQTVQIDWTRNRVREPFAAVAPFDRILVDSPCTNTGVMRRRVDVRWRLSPADFKRMQKSQIAIIEAVLPLLKPGGVLVYSTCSLEPEENEEVVRYFLEKMSILQLVQEKRSLPFRDGFDGAFAAKLLKAR